MSDLSDMTIEFYLEAMPDHVQLFWYRVIKKNIESGDWAELDDIYNRLCDILIAKGVTE